MRNAVWIACFALNGCSAHSPMILKPTTDVAAVARENYPAHSNPVLVIEGPLPSGVEYKIIATINVGKIWYSGADGILVEMARQAKQVGADAVINVQRWRQPSGFAWAAPHGQGQAVKILKKDDSVDLASLGKML